MYINFYRSSFAYKVFRYTEKKKTVNPTTLQFDPTVLVFKMISKALSIWTNSVFTFTSFKSEVVGVKVVAFSFIKSEIVTFKV